MTFFPIGQNNELNIKFKDIPECIEILKIFVDHYKKVGFEKPWIAYFISLDGEKIIGGGGFKGPPKNGKVEISYGTFKNFEGQGIGTQICKHLVDLSLKTDPAIKITAHTLPDNHPSIAILKKNGFMQKGEVFDEDDGLVLDWHFEG